MGEVDALKSKLHGGQPSHMHGGPPVHGSMHGVSPGQTNGLPNHPGMVQDEHRSLARAQEEAKASVMKMWDQLEKKDREVDALKSKLHGGQPSHMQGGPPVHGSMHGVSPGQTNGLPNHPGMVQRPLHMQPQSVPLKAQTHVSVVARTSCTCLRCARIHRALMIAP